MAFPLLRLPQEMQDEIYSYLVPNSMTIELSRVVHEGKDFVSLTVLSTSAFQDFRAVSFANKEMQAGVAGVLMRNITKVTIDIRDNFKALAKEDVDEFPPRPPNGVFKNISTVRVIAPFSIKYYRTIGKENVVGHVEAVFERDAAAENGWVKKSWSSTAISKNKPHNGKRQAKDAADCLEADYAPPALEGLSAAPISTSILWRVQRAFCHRHKRGDLDARGRPWTIEETEKAIERYQEEKFTQKFIEDLEAESTEEEL